MKRLALGLGITGGLSLIVAVIVGFVPRLNCGSYFIPDVWQPGESEIGCMTTAGHPGMFWAFIWAAVIFIAAAIVVQQLAAHRAGRGPSVHTPAPAPTVQPTPLVGFVPPPPYRGPAPVAAQPSAVALELKNLKELYDAGGLTPEEFAQAKARVLGSR